MSACLEKPRPAASVRPLPRPPAAQRALFPASYISALIAGFRRHPPARTGMHRTADFLEAFYLRGEGRRLTY